MGELYSEKKQLMKYKCTDNWNFLSTEMKRIHLTLYQLPLVTLLKMLWMLMPFTCD